MSQASTASQSAPQAKRNNKQPPRPLGPDTYTWRDFGSYRYQLVLSQAFILQSAHPIIDAAVGKDKKYKYDPWGRAQNSIKYLWPVVYARPEKAQEMALQLRELHREIKGVDKKRQALPRAGSGSLQLGAYDRV